METNTNSNFYLKFPTNDSNAQGPRGEKVVIYCDKNELDYVMQLLEYNKQNNPNLFENSENTLPFLQEMNGIASVAYQPATNQYKNLQGHTKTIPQSVNTYITNMLEESYMETAREIARADSNINFLLNDETYYDETTYIRNFPYISANYQGYLIESMKAKMNVLSRSNNIYIDGLNYQQYDQQQQYQQYNDSPNLGGEYESR